MKETIKFSNGSTLKTIQNNSSSTKRSIKSNLITTLCLDIVKNQWTIKTLNLTEPIERYIPKYYINKK